MAHRTGWRGLAVLSNRLTYKPPSLWWRRPTVRFEPEGLAIVGRQGSIEVLAWDRGGTGWRLSGVMAGRTNRAGIRISVLPAVSDVWHPVYASRDTWLPSTWTMPPLDELPALTEFLVTTPSARGHLGDGGRLEALVAELASRAWQRPSPPGEPLLGDRLDIYVAVQRTLDAMGWRRIQGRPVRGEVKPATAEVSQRARQILAPGVMERVSDGALDTAVRRHLDVAPWPFDVLIT
jgi:hypothetical protein